MIEIVEALDKKQMKAFATFPIKLYKHCKYYVPSFVNDEMNILDGKKNTNKGDSLVKCFLAYKDGKLAGRICGIINVESNKRYNEKAMRISRVDFIKDIDVLKALLGALQNWAREEGMDTLSGPWGFNDTDREGMLTYGFDELSNYATAYSYPYYAEFFNSLGFKKESEWVEYSFDISSCDPRYISHAQTVRAQGYKDLLDTMSVKEFIAKYGFKLFDCYNRCYADLDNFVNMEGEAVQSALDTFGGIVDKRFLSCIVNPEGKIVAFGIGIPHIGNALRLGKGSLVKAIIPLLWSLWFPKTVELMLIGVEPSYRNFGIHAMVVDRFMKGFKKAHIKNVWMDPVLTTNVKMLHSWNGMNKEIRARRQTYRIGVEELKVSD